MDYAIIVASTFRSALRRHGRSLVSLSLAASLAACGTSPSQDAADTNSAAAASDCRSSDNLLRDPLFTNNSEYGRGWRLAQHTGELSFEVTVDDGLLQMKRIDKEPWMLYRQTVESAALAGATVRYSAELKGDAPGEPMLHGFDHIAGLYVKAGREPARLADHEPNVGQWDWQLVTMEEKIPAGVTSVRVGFVHQAGGTLWARNPSLVIVSCD